MEINSSFLELLVFTNALLFSAVAIVIAGASLLIFDYLRGKGAGAQTSETLTEEKKKAAL